jgi:hypothetical protein
MERWSQYYKPAGMSQATGDPVKSTPKASAPVVDDFDDEPAPVAKAAEPAVKQEAPAAGGGRAEDILAMIRNRNKQ